MDKELLKRVGLTDYETSIYLTLLGNNQLSVYELAKKTGLYRQACYDALNRLGEKGFVSSAKEGKHLIFKAVNPEIILEYLSDEVEQFKQLLPELANLQKQVQDKLIVETYKGRNVIRVGLKDIISSLKKTKGEVLSTAVDESIPLAEDSLAVKLYEHDLKRFGIKERVIIKEGGKGIFKRKTTQYRKIPEKFFNPNPTQIYGDNIQIYLWGQPSHLIIIRNKEIADAYRKQFGLLWEVAK
ncbi:MAG: winged helix-turn-helix transcriptional regulator [Candidatus Diapherotrites archaeon]|nr:winged helix-turn-helix transcriptional regulator [Candidatus Diapherotrites archaeon]